MPGFKFESSRCRTLPEIIHERTFMFLGTRGPKLGQIYEKFKTCDKVAHTRQDSYLFKSSRCKTQIMYERIFM